MTRFDYQCQRGFSYLFTLFLVAILGLGLAVAAEMYSTSVQRDKEKELLFIGKQFSEAIGKYYEANKNIKAIVAPNNQNQQDKDQQNEKPQGEEAPIIGKVKNNNYPKTMDDLLLDTRSIEVKRHLRKVFVDPMTGKSEWGEKRIGGRLVGIYSLSNKTPIKQAFFEDEEVRFNGKAQYSDWVFAYPPNLKFDITNDIEVINTPKENIELFE